MKYLLFKILTVFLLCQVEISAQVLTNGGFENWATDSTAYFNPVGWYNINVFQSTVVQGTPRTGNHSANLKSVPDGSGGYTGGILYRNYVGNQKPLVLSGYWRGTFASDFFGQFHIRINVYDSLHNIIGSGDVYSPMATNVPNWTAFSLTLNYTSSATPASVDMWIMLQSLQAPVNGFIDDLSLTYAVGINEINKVNSFSCSPNPAVNKLIIENSGTVRNVEVYNPSGTQLKTFNPVLNPSKETSILLDISDLSPGIYLIRVTDENKNSATRRIIKM